MSTNPFKRLLALLPNPPLLVGTVVAIDSGVATIQLPDGTLMKARGDVAVSDHVFFRDNVIEGPAPNLPVEIIDV